MTVTAMTMAPRVVACVSLIGGGAFDAVEAELFFVVRDAEPLGAFDPAGRFFATFLTGRDGRDAAGSAPDVGGPWSLTVADYSPAWSLAWYPSWRARRRRSRRRRRRRMTSGL